MTNRHANTSIRVLSYTTTQGNVRMLTVIPSWVDGTDRYGFKGLDGHRYILEGNTLFSLGDTTGQLRQLSVDAWIG